MTALGPEDFAPPREAWAMRCFLVGALLLGLDFVLTDRGDLLEHLLADEVVATADVKVLAPTEDGVPEAFARAREERRADAGLNFMGADEQTRSYQVWLTAPTRDAALAELEALLAAFHEQHGGEVGRDLWMFSSSYVPPLRSPRVRTWSRRIVGGLLLLALAALAAGARLFLRSPPEGRARMTEMLFGRRTDDP